MVSFLSAFAWNCFEDSNIATRIIMGAAWAALATLVLWCVWMGWVKQHHEPSPEGRDSSAASAANGEVQDHASRSRADSTKTASRASPIDLEVLPSDSASGISGNANVQGESTISEMSRFQFWRSWPIAVDSESSVPPPRILTTSLSPARQKLLNVPEARVYRHQCDQGGSQRKTLFIKIISPLLLSAPDVHLRTLEKMWVDGIMHGPVWQDTIKKLNEEWQEFILYVSRQLSLCIVAGDRSCY
jgi:hypothetical protein